MEEENVILKRNISELFKTAQAELRRKDRQMEELENRYALTNVTLESDHVRAQSLHVRLQTRDL